MANGIVVIVMLNLENSLRKAIDDRFLKSIEILYGDKGIEISVDEMDETEYLLRSPENKRRLLAALDNVEHNRKLVIPDRNLFR